MLLKGKITTFYVFMVNVVDYDNPSILMEKAEFADLLFLHPAPSFDLTVTQLDARKSYSCSPPLGSQGNSRCAQGHDFFVPFACIVN